MGGRGSGPRPKPKADRWVDLHVRVPPAQKHWLRRRAITTGVSEGALLRWILDRAIGEDERTEPSWPQSRKPDAAEST